MSMNERTKTLLSLLDEYNTHFTAIKGSTKSQTADLIKPVSDSITERLYQAIIKNNKLNYAEYGALLGVSATIKCRLGELKLREARMIVRVGSNKSGYWEVVSLKDRKEGRYE